MHNIGVIIFLFSMATAFSGYVLPCFLGHYLAKSCKCCFQESCNFRLTQCLGVSNVIAIQSCTISYNYRSNWRARVFALCGFVDDSSVFFQLFFFEHPTKMGPLRLFYLFSSKNYLKFQPTIDLSFALFNQKIFSSFHWASLVFHFFSFAFVIIIYRKNSNRIFFHSSCFNNCNSPDSAFPLFNKINSCLNATERFDYELCGAVHTMQKLSPFSVFCLKRIKNICDFHSELAVSKTVLFLGTKCSVDLDFARFKRVELRTFEVGFWSVLQIMASEKTLWKFNIWFFFFLSIGQILALRFSSAAAHPI